MSHQYWVVGAMFGGKDDQLARFVKRGYWYCWDPKESKDIPKQVAELFPQIRVGDRIAVKKLLGTGSKEIEVRALGIVKDLDQSEWRIYVDWLVTGLERKVPIKGCVGSINGPFPPSEWTGQVFSI